MVSAILAARHRTFVLVVTSLFVLFVFLCTINFFFFFFVSHIQNLYKLPINVVFLCISSFSFKVEIYSTTATAAVTYKQGFFLVRVPRILRSKVEKLRISVSDDA